MGCPKLAYSYKKQTHLKCVWKSYEQSKTRVRVLDYGARMYDPQLGRFHTMDPLGEWDFKTTPYGYARNNPINAIDLFGLTVEYIYDDKGNIVGYRVTGDDIVTYQGYLKTIDNGEGSMDNLYTALDQAASSNEGEGGPFASTVEEATVTGTHYDQEGGETIWGSGDWQPREKARNTDRRGIDQSNPSMEQRGKILKWIYNLFKSDKKDDGDNTPNETTDQEILEKSTGNTPYYIDNDPYEGKESQVIYRDDSVIWKIVNHPGDTSIRKWKNEKKLFKFKSKK